MRGGVIAALLYKQTLFEERWEAHLWGDAEVFRETTQSAYSC
jgi:hypothetical protein